MISVSKTAMACVVPGDGEMTIYHAAEMKGELFALARPQYGSGNRSVRGQRNGYGRFQLLLLAKREAANAGKPLRLIAHSPATLEVLDLFNMASYFGDPVMMPRAHISPTKSDDKTGRKSDMDLIRHCKLSSWRVASYSKPWRVVAWFESEPERQER